MDVKGLQMQTAHQSILRQNTYKASTGTRHCGSEIGIGTGSNLFRSIDLC